MFQQREVSCPHGAKGLRGLKEVLLVYVDPVLQVDLAIHGGELGRFDGTPFDTSSNGRDDTSAGDALGLAMHLPFFDNITAVDLDQVALYRQDRIVQHSATPVIVDIDIRYRSRRGQHTEVDR